MAALVVAGGVAFTLRRHPGATVPVTVSVFDDGAPLAGRPVVFQDANGEVVASLTSGPDGKVSSPLAAGGMITVAYGTSMRQLVTVMNVVPGETVEIGEHDNDEDGAGNTATIARVAMPGTAPGAARYSVDLGVGAIEPKAGIARLPVLGRFVGDGGAFSALGLAHRADGRPTAFSFVEARVPDGGDIDVVLPAWRTDFHRHDVVLGGLGDDLHVATSELTVIAGEQQFVLGGSTDASRVHLDVPAALGSTMSYRLELAYGASADRAVLVRRIATFPDAVDVDLRTALLPRVSAARASGERARPRLDWTEDGDPKDADALVIQLAWPRTKEHVWTILAPPSSRAGLRVPALPDTLAAWRPDAPPIQMSVALVAASAIAGYEDARQHGVHRFSELPDRESTMRISRSGDIDF